MMASGSGELIFMSNNVKIFLRPQVIENYSCYIGFNALNAVGPA